ncbi:MAG TPA: FkbM family methyltransferase [Anaerolineae bacterium]|nr:FkbM family methyltransferase [Anaerolineae bacterium]
MKLRTRINLLFIQNPRLGRLAYWLLRRLGWQYRQTSRLLTRLHKLGFNPQTILDVGANTGEWSRMAADIFPHATYYLIEPQEEMRGLLTQLTQDLPHAHWFQAGAAASPGQLTLTLWPDLAGSSFLPPPQADLAAQGQQRTVPIVTINDLITQNKMPIPDLIKLDVQGFEREVLDGATHCFGTTELFIMEASLFRSNPRKPLAHELIAFMHHNNYFLYDIVGHRYRPYDGALGQVDLCFAAAHSPLRAEARWQ